MHGRDHPLTENIHGIAHVHEDTATVHNLLKSSPIPCTHYMPKRRTRLLYAISNTARVHVSHAAMTTNIPQLHELLKVERLPGDKQADDQTKKAENRTKDLNNKNLNKSRSRISHLPRKVFWNCLTSSDPPHRQEQHYSRLCQRKHRRLDCTFPPSTQTKIRRSPYNSCFQSIRNLL